MAFHVSCPITCRRICDCELGFQGGLQSGEARRGFLEDVGALEEFLRDPWFSRPYGAAQAEVGTIRVLVPKLEPPLAPVPYGGGDGDVKHGATQRQVLTASMAAENYLKKLEIAGAVDSPCEQVLREHEIDLTKDDQGSTVKVMCRLCFSSENEGSNRAMKMLSCQSCGKKYHGSCLRSWAEHRDLFHWNSWVCAACRICEVCRRAGDPNKLMYCKRCDGAYHCYCQQPPHKNVSHGPYLCPKHTRCHSCGSTVPGSGPSTRWFLGYTCCDACGRLFVKGNYCPVCLKVYRDSETTPMVCCDICERWVHCVCDGISDEKYQQFQTDQKLQYVCAACRGDCYQVKDIDDAVRELWSRRDEADRGLIANLRAAAGLPTEEAISNASYSEDESNGPVVQRNVQGRSLKFSVKGISDKLEKVAKDSGKNNTKVLSSNKKSVKKKEFQIKFVSKADGMLKDSEVLETAAIKNNLSDQVQDNVSSYRADGQEKFSSRTKMADDSAITSSTAKKESNNHVIMNEVKGIPADRVLKIQNKQQSDSHFKECGGKTSTKYESVKGTKLVIHIGGRNKNATSSPMSEGSSCQKDQDLSAFHGGENTSHSKKKKSKNGFPETRADCARVDGEGTTQGIINEMKSSNQENKYKNVIKLGKVSEVHSKNNGNTIDKSEGRNTFRGTKIGKTVEEVDLVNGKARLANDEAVLRKETLLPNLQVNNNEQLVPKLISASHRDSKPLLKLKFKNPYLEHKSSWASQGEENSVKGQRSKRKRPSVEKIDCQDDEGQEQQQDRNKIDDAVDANWILQKLGKDAIGKKIEVYQKSDDSWHQGVVSGLAEGTSYLSVHFDDGRKMSFELGKQRIRLIPRKPKKVKT
ncbi:hypothetical protein HPP92_009360 [Vanilla planifolia]|uniref:PHD-type domain-containing protein n=1 Tax=Vanilla planifolia TaxID=51239 RepID=A0A835R829_VANPL|nr:hypothetical protein HPP92_009360 [Vanilla planifolia]